MATPLEPYDIAALRNRVRTGWAPTFLFFWGHSGGPEIGKQCLSQWYPAAFSIDGYAYSSAEHYMMVQKALLFGDVDTAERIRSCQEAAQAKELGRQVREFDNDVWEQHRFGIVAAGSHAKFSQNPSLRTFLLSTGEHVLVEASPKDKVWGIGLAEDNPGAKDPSKWLGLNLLGFALMQARAFVAKE